MTASDMPDFDNSTILITGGTGSFGRAAALHFLSKSGVREVRILSRDEAKQDEMRGAIKDARVRFFLGDVRDIGSVDDAMKGVDYVFQAAALKQVPSCEFFPLEAVRTNVEGSGNVMKSAIRNNVKRVICLSTDKAVHPINAMGMTKALMEKVAISTARQYTEGSTVIACVRYGNVMCSRGSVIPKFISQVKAGQPLTVTVPAMTRFMMPMAHAIDLVEFAMKNANPGDIFVRKAPASTIGTLAEAVADLFQSDVPVIEQGIRHGEKIFETLASAHELSLAEEMDEYYRIQSDTRDLNYDLYFDKGSAQVEQYTDYTSNNTNVLSKSELKTLLLSLPEVQTELTNWADTNIKKLNQMSVRSTA